MSDEENSSVYEKKSDKSNDQDLQNLFEESTNDSTTSSSTSTSTSTTSSSQSDESVKKEPESVQNADESKNVEKRNIHSPKIETQTEQKPIEEEEKPVKENSESEEQQIGSKKQFSKTIILEKSDKIDEPQMNSSRQQEEEPLKSRKELLHNNNKTKEIDRSNLLSYLMQSYQFSANDFKFVGRQFQIGKFNPNSQTRFEQRFQLIWKARQKILAKKNSKNTSFVSTYMPPKYIDDEIDDGKPTKKQQPNNFNLSDYSFYSNDLKFKGRRFNFSKYEKKDEDKEPKTSEEKFQAMFKHKLEKFKPKFEDKASTLNLDRSGLLELHQKLLVKSYRNIKNDEEKEDTK